MLRHAPPPDVREAETGQRVVFDRETFLVRELAKRLPLDEAWPGPAGLGSRARALGVTDPPTRRLPVHLLGGIFVVGQSQVDNLTYMIDCGDAGVAVIDPGYDPGHRSTIAALDACGVVPSDVRWVLDTHCHADHAMANHLYAATGAQVLVHEADLEALRVGAAVLTYSAAEVEELYPDDGAAPATFPVVSDLVPLHDGQVLRLGNRTIRVIHTPGHTAGSVAFVLDAGGERVLVSGDTVLFDRRLSWQDPAHADDAAYVRSLERLAADADGPWDVLLPGHGAVVLSGAQSDVEQARDTATARWRRGEPIFAWPDPGLDYRRTMIGRPLLLARRDPLGG